MIFIGVDSASNRNEYQEYFLESKGGRCVGLTTLPLQVSICEIREPQPPETLRAFKVIDFPLLHVWYDPLETKNICEASASYSTARQPLNLTSCFPSFFCFLQKGPFRRFASVFLSFWFPADFNPMLVFQWILPFPHSMTNTSPFSYFKL